MWSVVYKKCYNPDGSLFFPEKLSKEFLESAKKTMGSVLFANQYLNEVFPSDDQKFNQKWFRYYEVAPPGLTYAFVDPAISVEDDADYSAFIVVRTTETGDIYVLLANRYRINPSEIVNKIFELQKEFNCELIGVESVAYQKALLFMLDEEMKRRTEFIPVLACNPGTSKTKEMRILSLVPRFEWGRMFFPQGASDLEEELLQFPRGRHDDLIDALQQVTEILTFPEKQKDMVLDESNPTHKDYEHNLALRYAARANEEIS
jgi:predicted phage terminase large subunit-like protein